MNFNKHIRWFVLLFGIFWELVLFFVAINFDANYTISDFFNDLLVNILLFLWTISPNVTYFLSTKKIQSKEVLIPPALILCLTQTYFTLTYVYSTSSTSGFIVFFGPALEIVLMGIGFVIGDIIKNGLWDKGLFKK